MNPRWIKTKDRGVFIRHERDCPAYSDKRCRCNPGFRGEVWNPTTKRPDKSTTYHAVDEAKGWVADYRRGLDAPAPKTTSALTVGEFHATFIAAAHAGTALRKGGKTYSPVTLKLYARDYRVHLQAHVAKKPIDAMDARAWQTVVEKVQACGRQDGSEQALSPGSVSRILAGVSAAYKWGASPARRIVQTNPLRDVEHPAIPRTRNKRVVAPEAIPTLLAALRVVKEKNGPMPNPGIPIIWAIMFYAGLRISEAIALDWSGVDLRGGWITVGESKSDAGTGRRIPIVPELAAILRDWQATTGAMLGPVAPGTRGVRLSTSGVESNARKRWKRAGLTVYSPHEARHTFASVMIANRDVSIAELKEWLGHVSLQTTDTYVKTLPGFRQDSVHARLAGTFA